MWSELSTMHVSSSIIISKHLQKHEHTTTTRSNELNIGVMNCNPSSTDFSAVHHLSTAISQACCVIILLSRLQWNSFIAPQSHGKITSFLAWFTLLYLVTLVTRATHIIEEYNMIEKKTACNPQEVWWFPPSILSQSSFPYPALVILQTLCSFQGQANQSCPSPSKNPTVTWTCFMYTNFC